MTKADIVNEIAKNTGIDKATVLTTLEAFMDSVKDSLSKDENVSSRKELRKLLATSPRIQLSSFRNTIFRHSNLPRLLHCQ